jgi:hypothetical protein
LRRSDIVSVAMSLTPEDRDLLSTLRRQQTELQQSLEQLNARLGALEDRHHPVPPEFFLPPIPADEPLLPPIPPLAAASPVFPPIPAFPPFPSFPPLPPSPVAAPKRSLESHFGRWLTRIGVLFGVIALVLLFALPSVQAALGKAGLLALSAALSLGVAILGERIERKDTGRPFFGRAVTALALAWLYLTAYAACYSEQLQVITNPLIAGLVLLLWSIYVLLLAERKQSQILAVFALVLAYIGTAINPLDRFTMAADLLLAGTAAVFLVRNGWAVLTTVGIAGTYLALFRRLVIDSDGEIVLDTSRTLHFLPHAVYLLAAWLLFTGAAIFTRSLSFRGVRRFLVVSLNNAAVAALLMFTAYIAGYGISAMGWTLLDTGLVFLVFSRVAGFAETDPVELMGAYAAQGLALITGGFVVVFTGVTRGVLLLLETLLLGIAGAFAGDRILTVSTYFSAAFATIFLIWEIAVNAHHPWLLGFGGALVMFINAWACRGEVRNGPQERSTIVASTSGFCIMALGLIAAALATLFDQGGLPVSLAFAALILTFSIYYITLFELPPLAQTLLLAAQVLLIFPAETGEELPWWSIFWVAAITIVLVAWWSRQRITRTGPWTLFLTCVYALALVGLVTQVVRPYLDASGWLIVSSLLSIVFLVFGAFTRVWAIAAMGQFFLLIAVRHFFQPVGGGNGFPWSWGTAALPIMTVFATARATQQGVRLFTNLPETWRRGLLFLARGYQLIALAMLIRWVFAVVPPSDQIACFLFLGTLVLSLNVRMPSLFGVRCSYVLSGIGAWLFLSNFQSHDLAMATLVNGMAMLLLLCQPALLRQNGLPLVTRFESWALLLLAFVTGWLFVSGWVLTRMGVGYLTMGWALYALFLFVFGLAVWERRLRWCALAVLLATILRVFCSDFWGLSSGYRVLTLIVLTFVTLSLGYVIVRVADRRQSWL